MSVAVTSRKPARQVLAEAARGIGSVLAAFTIQYNIIHHTNKSQWWFPLGCVAVATLLTMIEGRYDVPIKFRDEFRTVSNFTSLMIIFGVPIVAFIAGVLAGGWHWCAGALVVLAANILFYFGFGQRGLPMTTIVVCLLVVATT